MIDVIKKFLNKFLRNLFRKKKHVKLGLYGPPNGGKCVTPDTEVILQNGEIKQIKEIFDFVNEKKGKTDISKSNEIIIECKDLGIIIPSFDTDRLKITPKTVSFVYAQKYNGEIYKIKTSSGRTIKVTPNHPLIRLSNQGVQHVRSADIQVGDSVAITKKLCLSSPLELPKITATCFNVNGNTIQSISKFHNPKSISIPSFIDEDLASFVAYTLSESYHTENRIKFSNLDHNLLNHFDYLSKKLFRLVPIKRINKGVPELELNSKTLTDYLKEVLHFHPCTSESKKIPSQLMGLPDNLISNFLRAIYDCEGYVSKDTITGGAEIELSSKSKKLLEQTQILLNRFGIVAKFWEKQVDNEEYYRLSIRGSNNHRLFRDKIGFTIKKKRERLDNLCTVCSKRNTYFLPVMEILEKIRGNADLTQEQFYSDNKHIARMLRKNQITMEKLGIVAKKTKNIFINKLSSSDAIWDKIVSIEKAPYSDWVYDLTVEDTHTFIVSNGLIAHNTTLANKICQDWLGEDMGKVSNIAHETREIQIKEQINLKSKGKELSFNLVDTPGIATKIDYEEFMKVGMKEKEAKKRAKEATKGVIDSIKWLDEMDTVVIVLDSTKDPYSQVNITIIGNLAARDIPVMIIANKVDLKKSNIKKIQAAFPQYEVIGISAKYGNHIEDFYESLFKLAG